MTMTRSLKVLLSAALLLSPAVRGQQTPQSQQTPSGRLEDDPGYKRLSPEAQAWVRAMSANLETAIAETGQQLNQRQQQGEGRAEAIARASALVAGKSISGHLFDAKTRIDAAVFNAAGEYALVARWMDSSQGGRPAFASGVFTSRRRVVSEGDVVESGKYIADIGETVCLNEKGEVGYAAQYADSPAHRGSGVPRWGLFVEKRLVFSPLGAADKAPAFWFSDSGEMYIDGVPGTVFVSAPAAPAEKKPGALDGLSVKPLPLPKQLANTAATPVPQSQKQAGCGDGAAPKKSRFGVQLPESVQKRIDLAAGNTGAHSRPCPAGTK